MTFELELNMGGWDAIDASSRDRRKMAGRRALTTTSTLLGFSLVLSGCIAAIPVGSTPPILLPQSSAPPIGIGVDVELHGNLSSDLLKGAESAKTYVWRGAEESRGFEFVHHSTKPREWQAAVEVYIARKDASVVLDLLSILSGFVVPMVQTMDFTMITTITQPDGTRMPPIREAGAYRIWLSWLAIPVPGSQENAEREVLIDLARQSITRAAIAQRQVVANSSTTTALEAQNARRAEFEARSEVPATPNRREHDGSRSSPVAVAGEPSTPTAPEKLVSQDSFSDANGRLHAYGVGDWTSGGRRYTSGMITSISEESITISFSYLARRFRVAPTTWVCTSGRSRTAGVSGMTLGDFATVGSLTDSDLAVFVQGGRVLLDVEGRRARPVTPECDAAPSPIVERAQNSERPEPRPPQEPAREARATAPQSRANAPESRASRSVGASAIRDIQTELVRLGYGPGRADGVANASTRRAIRNYQRVSKRVVTGEPSEELLADLRKPCGIVVNDFQPSPRGGCRKPNSVPGIRGLYQLCMRDSGDCREPRGPNGVTDSMLIKLEALEEP